MQSAPAELKQNGETGIYYVHWTEGRRSKRCSTRQTNLGAAQAFFGSWLLMGKEAAGLSSAPITCGDAWELYAQDHLKRNVIKPENYQSSWNNLKCAFAALTPAAVTQDKIDAYVRDRTSGKISARGPAKLGTVWKELRQLVTVWNYAVKKRRLASTELPVITLPLPPLPRERWLKRPEITKLLLAAAKLRDPRISRVERFLWLGLETAGRREAIQSLKWNQVDFEMGVIHLNPEGRRQTSKRRADVPISEALAPILRQAYAERINDYVLGTTVIYHINEELAALALSVGVEGVTPHVLRHTAATHMARAGVSLWKIAGVLGNSVAMVEAVYAKHCPEGLQDAVNSISGVERKDGRSAQDGRASSLQVAYTAYTDQEEIQPSRLKSNDFKPTENLHVSSCDTEE